MADEKGIKNSRPALDSKEQSKDVSKDPSIDALNDQIKTIDLLQNQYSRPPYGLVKSPSVKQVAY